MRKGLIIGLVALLTIFMMTGCPNDPAPSGPKIYTVTFSDEGAKTPISDLPAPVKVQSGKSISDIKDFDATAYAFLASSPTRDNYKFVGWTIGGNGTANAAGMLTSLAFTTTTAITGNITVKPYWWQPTVTLELNGGTLDGVATSFNVAYKGKLGAELLADNKPLKGKTPAITVTGFTFDFDGWYVTNYDGAQITDTSEQELGQDRTIYAKYTLTAEDFSSMTTVFETGLSPKSFVERLYLENNGLAVYKFDLATAKTPDTGYDPVTNPSAVKDAEYGDFTDLAVDYMLDAVQFKNYNTAYGTKIRYNNMRAYGVFTAEHLGGALADARKFRVDNTGESGDYDKEADGVPIYQYFNTDVANPWIISAYDGTYGSLSSVSIDQAYQWGHFEYKIDGSKVHSAFKVKDPAQAASGANLSDDPDDWANLPAADFKQAVYFGIGITGEGNSGNSGVKNVDIPRNGITQWVRNVRLVHKDGPEFDVYGTYDPQADFVSYKDPTSFQYRSKAFEASQFGSATYTSMVKVFDPFDHSTLATGEDPDLELPGAVKFTLSEWIEDKDDAAAFGDGKIFASAGDVDVAIVGGKITVGAASDNWRGIDINPTHSDIGASISAQKYQITVTISGGTPGDVLRLNQGGGSYTTIEGSQTTIGAGGTAVLTGIIPANFGTKVRLCPADDDNDEADGFTIEEITIVALGELW